MKTIKILAFAALLAVFAMLPISSTVSAKDNSQEVIVLSTKNVVVLNDEVSGDSVAKVVREANDMDSGTSISHKLGLTNSHAPIYIFLFTPGGSVQAGLELMEGLKGIKRPVHTITSFSASMGFQIAQGLGDRLILKSGVMMSHMAYGGAEGSFNGTADSQLRRRLGLWEDRIKEMDELTVKRTNGKQTMESYLKAYNPELWLTGTQAVDQGYADKVVSVKCDKSLDGYTTKTTMVMGIIPVQYDVSNCPLNTSPVNVRMSLDTTKGRMELADFLKEDGGFGISCIQLAVLNSAKPCAVDTNLTLDKVNSARASFLDRFSNIQNHVIPFTAR